MNQTNQDDKNQNSGHIKNNQNQIGLSIMGRQPPNETDQSYDKNPKPYFQITNLFPFFNKSRFAFHRCLSATRSASSDLNALPSQERQAHCSTKYRWRRSSLASNSSIPLAPLPCTGHDDAPSSTVTESNQAS